MRNTVDLLQRTDYVVRGCSTYNTHLSESMLYADIRYKKTHRKRKKHDKYFLRGKYRLR
jgi:hypothetical protein